MREIHKRYTTATVPLNRLHLVQASLFDERTYWLPAVTPGQEALIYDADQWQIYNGRRGTVTKYSYFTGLYTILFNNIYERKFYGREIMKIRG